MAAQSSERTEIKPTNRNQGPDPCVHLPAFSMRAALCVLPAGAQLMTNKLHRYEINLLLTAAPTAGDIGGRESRRALLFLLFFSLCKVLLYQ